MSYWVNGQPCQQISVSDRAVAFGDGCFTTIHGVNQQAQMLKEHIARLTRDCLRLKITAPDWGELEHHLTEICTQQVDEEFVLKVIISRGVGGRGYSSIGFTQPTIIVSVSPFPSHYTQLQCQGAKLILSQTPVSRNPLLAGMKHLNRLEQVLIRQEIDEAQADEAIVLDTDGIIIECCSANVFWRIGQTVYTPVLSHCGVNGLMRQKIIALLVGSQYHLEEVERFASVLAHCDEVIMCNALMPVLPVKSIQIASQENPLHYASRELFEYLFLRCKI
ncbi:MULTISPECIES: aminodeoxychorismate lyase [Providencia]|uniref:aminodeoxychorismate lyase n=1 Tax=Providencia TaxID=586 RepID=UPI00197ECDC4|nr:MULTISPECIES: aminodeoxychorismate lyase [Providencia]MBN4863440.1 aminodeoxychorismate lyase [Providencia stuartii]MBN4876301.1 aminodeoxychorismate lyase [Providencia stuartii]MBN4878117.1 aminodeoxychorismate lyase [Providencia stuartii]MBN4881963.1 aminodeoxychorismate lyase [Providencia stuartii]HEM8292703.1 aminodeoxychorismate lyase [Providencia stuartii]